MKALVTGGGGFLGQHIVSQLLDAGHEVTVFSRSDYPELRNAGANLIQGDIQSFDNINQACKNIDVVFHTASKVNAWGRYQDFYTANVIGTQNVIDACLQNKVEKLIYTSTPSVVISDYDICDGNEDLPYPTKFLSPYQKTKAEAELRILQANKTQGLWATILRPHAIWGAGDKYFFPELVHAAKQNQLKIVGNGQNKISMVHVKNAAAAHIQAAESENANGKIYFINEPEPVDMWQWINHLIGELGLPIAKQKIPFKIAYYAGAVLEVLYKILRLQGKPRITRYTAALLAKHHYFDVSNAIKDFNFTLNISPEEGIKELLQSYKVSENT